VGSLNALITDMEWAAECAAPSSISFDLADAAGSFRIAKPFSNMSGRPEFVGKIPKQEARLTGTSPN
jgi:hypothetical protein